MEEKKMLGEKLDEGGVKVGWENVKLGAFIDFMGGGTPDKKKSEYWNGNIKWASVKDVKDKYLYETQDRITELGLKNSSSQLARDGELILVTRISPGKCVIAKDDISINQDLKIVKPKLDISTNFLYYFFNAKENELIKRSSGTTVKGIRLEEIRAIEINLPPLPEQRTIISKIEQLFSELDNGIANLRLAQEQLKVYRQAVLKKAFEGDWDRVELNQISNAMGGFAFKSKDFNDNGKYQVIRIGNIRPGKLRLNKSPVFIDNVEKKIIDKYLLKQGDVVITLTGTRKKRDYGFTTLINKDNLLLNQRIGFLRFSNKCLPEFFLYYSWTEPFKDQFFASETGNVGQGNVGMKAIKSTIIPLPPLEEQNAIVYEIETRLSVCDKVEQDIEENLEKAEALRQSILKKAFEGKLLDERELEEVRSAPDWEPAEVLLERVRAERAASGKKGRA